MRSLRAVVAEPDARQRLKSARFLRRSKGITVVGTARDGLELLVLTERMHPDLIVTEITMPGMNGFKVAYSVKNASPSTKILFLIHHREQTCQTMAEFPGVDGVVRKSELRKKLSAAVL